MSRVQKVLVALAVAVLLHGLLLRLAVSPMLADGMADGSADAGGDSPVAAPASDLAAGGESLPLDVGWQEPLEADDETPAPAAETPRERPARKPDPPATALPTPATPKAEPLPAAPPAAAPREVSRAGSDYARQVRQHLARFAGGLPPGASGEARVQFVVAPDGRVSEVRLVKASGHLGLDAVALSLPDIAQPLPSPGETAQRLEVPVQAVAQGP